MNTGFSFAKYAGADQTEPSFPEEDVIDPVKRRLAELSHLEADWDSYGGLPPTLVSIQSALGFVRLAGQQFWHAYGAGVKPTSISPLPSGGIELEWRTSAELFAVEISSVGRWGYLLKRGSGRETRY
ncbi:MAG: hypothetical protein M3Q50_08315 [Chloroflexota bacterium]|nr:hypothetical protein [Chloroflexota bacterium]